ncbi:hypothetical protein HN51_063041 [Arachis hypogaea]|nr:uncharacterized protein DS421_11g339430 [Arachis hypogaea]
MALEREKDKLLQQWWLWCRSDRALEAEKIVIWELGFFIGIQLGLRFIIEFRSPH